MKPAAEISLAIVFCILIACVFAAACVSQAIFGGWEGGEA